MQAPLFRRYGIDEATFWARPTPSRRTTAGAAITLAPEISYLNHLLTYVLAGKMPGLGNQVLRECGREIEFYPGCRNFSTRLPRLGPRQAGIREARDPARALRREHRPRRDDPRQRHRPPRGRIWACEFIENPLQPGFLRQKEFPLEAANEIAQIGMVIDNTTKTRAIFEINKGTNKNAAIDVNAKVTPEDRRIPLQNMIYIADGPSDVPSFSVVKKGGGKTYAVYNPAVRAEFEQNDRLRQAGRIDHYGPADYTENSATTHWLHLQIEKMCDRIVTDREAAVASRVTRPPRHLNASPEEEAARRAAKLPKQSSFLE
jgi:hypothetical protein